MTAEHKAKLAAGREAARVENKPVNAYLAALTDNKPKRGRKRTADSVRSQLASVEAELDSADAIGRLQLFQKRMDLQAELESMQGATDIKALEDAFVTVAKPYGDRHGISYKAWRLAGVDAAVLKAAGISRAD